jgi:hypothetical protein
MPEIHSLYFAGRYAFFRSGDLPVGVASQSSRPGFKLDIKSYRIWYEKVNIYTHIYLFSYVHLTIRRGIVYPRAYYGDADISESRVAPTFIVRIAEIARVGNAKTLAH